MVMNRKRRPSRYTDRVILSFPTSKEMICMARSIDALTYLLDSGRVPPVASDRFPYRHRSTWFLFRQVAQGNCRSHRTFRSLNLMFQQSAAVLRWSNLTDRASRLSLSDSYAVSGPVNATHAWIPPSRLVIRASRTGVCSSSVMSRGESRR